MTPVFHDISAPLDDKLPTWPTSRGWSRELTNDLQAGDAVTESYLAMDVHCGTHVDAPLHHLAQGGGVDTFPLDAFWGPCLVVDARGLDVIPQDLVRSSVPAGTQRVLFLTDNSEQRRLRQPAFDPAFVALSLEAATALSELDGLRLVGNDYLSVQPYGASDEVHRVLLRRGVALLEGVDLTGVAPGSYELSAFPVAVPGAEAAPVRAVLRQSGTAA